MIKLAEVTLNLFQGKKKTSAEWKLVRLRLHERNEMRILLKKNYFHFLFFFWTVFTTSATLLYLLLSYTFENRSAVFYFKKCSTKVLCLEGAFL